MKQNMTCTFRREIPVEDGYDVFVAGGGPAGCAAAICAARLGAKVLLVEETGCLGGMGTSGLVCAWDGMADGTRNIVGGILLEIVETLYQRGQLPEHANPDSWRRNYLHPTKFRPEPLKMLLDELAAAAGVEVRFFTRVVDVERSPDRQRVEMAVLHQVDGLRCVKAAAFVDATGHAHLSAMAGAPYRLAGRDTERPMPSTLCALITGVDWTRAKPYSDYVEQAIADGFFIQPERRVPGLWPIGRNIGNMNTGHVFNVNATDQKSLSAAIAMGRRVTGNWADFYRAYVPGFEASELVATAPLLGVRESRRIVGEYELTFDDFRSCRHFPDQIGVFNKEVDIHPYDTSPAQQLAFAKSRRERTPENGWIPEGRSYGLPYGILVPKGWENLWAPGRAASTDVQVHGSTRVMPAAMMMGQAAGVAAVLSVRTGRPAFGIDTKELARTLRAQGAYLP